MEATDSIFWNYKIIRLHVLVDLFNYSLYLIKYLLKGLKI
jgi:hypothetical protein